jgi:hypothetical protein
MRHSPSIIPDVVDRDASLLARLGDVLLRAVKVLCRSSDDIPTMALIQRAKLRRVAAKRRIAHGKRYIA